MDFFKIINLYNKIQNGGLSKIRYVPTAIICMCSRIFKSGISRKETYSGKTIDIFFVFYVPIFSFIYNFFCSFSYNTMKIPKISEVKSQRLHPWEMNLVWRY